MKGVVLAGGTATRLRPLTIVTNKHLLPVFDRPMIYYPLQLLADLGVREVMVVVGGQSVGDMIELLGDGKLFDLDLTYRYQDGPHGIAQAIGLAREWVGQDNFVVVLGDNIMFRSDALQSAVDWMDAKARPHTAACVVTRVDDPRPYGVAILGPAEDEPGRVRSAASRVLRFVEKPAVPPSDLVPIGFYVFGPDVFEVIDQLEPSARGEYEITDVLNDYAIRGRLDVSMHMGYWGDAGTVEGLMAAAAHVRLRG